MVIDFHTHCFPDKVAAKAKQVLTYNCVSRGHNIIPCTDMTADSLVEHMDMWGVDLSLVMPIATKPAQTEHLNAFAASLPERTGGRLISFGSVHPETDDYKRDIDMIVSLGLKGLKFHPEYQGFTVDEPRMLRIYSYALDKGLIILFHAGADLGCDKPYHSDPKRFAKVLDEMRGGVIVAAHLGSHAMWDEVEEYLVGRDIYFDTSMGQEFYPRDQFERIVNDHGAERILFASDSPWSKAGEEIERIKNTALTESEKRLIFSENAKRLLGIN